ncbi:peptidoglycan-binding domain-containing protein [Salipiger abyssi]|uniref:Putative peptidoglycan binding protein n=1 Tax=Salipiger abyssi TaxID=1250539 RepID=A0A1P8V093_9RHOB|nr:peptidoglycan-binding domain-containing protein [Salipiger abyssi]APZ55045.1 putative peptidoglycan binding protein [Salipiger abyssi]
MHLTSRLIAAMALALAACEAPTDSTGNWPGEAPPAPERMADGTCWAREVTPAIYEHVMGEIQVVQAEIAEDGTVIRPPVYRRAPVPRVVKPRGELRFETPCPEQTTPELISSVQRALAARGYFSGSVTGRFDAPTQAAIRKYQKERGLDSAQLSLETARALGLIATPLDAL